MLALQAGVVAAPREVTRPRMLDRFTGRWWALVPVGSIVAVIFAIRYASGTATGLTYLALVAIPPLAAAALAWAARGPGRWPVGRVVFGIVVAGVLFALAWADGNSLVGQGAAALLSALSCVTLGVLLAAVTPPGWLKVGIIVMAAADVWLVTSDLLQAPNATLVAAQPAAGLPRLQSETFGSISMGYGDMFVAGLLGAVMAANRRAQWGAALLTLLLASAMDVLFLVLNELPATVPVAVALIVIEVVKAFRRRRTRSKEHTRTRAGPRAGGDSVPALRRAPEDAPSRG